MKTTYNTTKLEKILEDLRIKAEYVNADYYYPKYIRVSKILEEALNPVEAIEVEKGKAGVYVKLLELKEDEVVARVEALEADLRQLRKDSAPKGSVCICSHNTILALKYDGRVSHIITQGDNDRNMINLGEVNSHLGVPRYEPKVANTWLKEELVLNSVYNKNSDEHNEMMSHYEKYTLGERELRGLVLEDKMKQLHHAKRNLVMINLAKEEA